MPPFHYPSAFAPVEAGYVRPVVKIELGARSDDWPATRQSMEPYLATALPVLAEGAAFQVCTLEAERTFGEKALLLHEETFRPLDKPRKGRMARHYYDLWCLIVAGVGERASANIALFARVAAHRKIYFPLNWVEYETLRQGSLNLQPPDHHIDDWRHDYEEMRGVMFFGEVPEFEEILRTVNEFICAFNQGAPDEPTAFE